MPKEEKRSNRVRKILDMKRQPPEHQRLDIEVKEGGRSLLHDDFGMPKVTPPPRLETPSMREIPNEPVVIKASIPDLSKVRTARGNVQRRDHLGKQTVTAQGLAEDDDKFIPPKSNFVSVGQKEHTWYDDRVAGPSEMVDNNDEMDTESLQGLDPMADVENEKMSEVRKSFENRLKNVFSGVDTQLESIVNTDQLEQFKKNIFGKGGLLDNVLKQFRSIPPNERQVVGELVNHYIEELKLQLDAKANELEEEDDEEEDSDEDGVDQYRGADYDGEQEDTSESDEDDGVMLPADEKAPSTAKISSTLEEGQYGILIDDKLFTVAEDSAKAREALTRLVLGNNVDLKRVQVIKRVSVDFGILLEE